MGTCQDWIMAIFMLVKGQWNEYLKKKWSIHFCNELLIVVDRRNKKLECLGSKI